VKDEEIMGTGWFSGGTCLNYPSDFWVKKTRVLIGGMGITGFISPKKNRKNQQCQCFFMEIMGQVDNQRIIGVSHTGWWFGT
jgi:hypothetical protein